MTDELQEKALAFFKTILERDEEGGDAILSTLTEEDGEEIQEALGMADHLLDIHLGYVDGCVEVECLIAGRHRVA